MGATDNYPQTAFPVRGRTVAPKRTRGDASTEMCATAASDSRKVGLAAVRARLGLCCGAGRPAQGKCSGVRHRRQRPPLPDSLPLPLPEAALGTVVSASPSLRSLWEDVALGCVLRNEAHLLSEPYSNTTSLNRLRERDAASSPPSGVCPIKPAPARPLLAQLAK